MTTERGDAWAAGLYEGEGSVGIASRGYPRLSLGMTDREPVEWFRDVLGWGSIHVQNRPACKPMHRWEGGGWVHLREFHDRMARYLSPRRLRDLEAVLARKPERPTSPPCAEPSPAAYRRHLRADEPPCAPCRQANTDQYRERTGAAPRYATGEGYR